MQQSTTRLRCAALLVLAGAAVSISWSPTYGAEGFPKTAYLIRSYYFSDSELNGKAGEAVRVLGSAGKEGYLRIRLRGTTVLAPESELATTDPRFSFK